MSEWRSEWSSTPRVDSEVILPKVQRLSFPRVSPFIPCDSSKTAPFLRDATSAQPRMKLLVILDALKDGSTVETSHTGSKKLLIETTVGPGCFGQMGTSSF